MNKQNNSEMSSLQVIILAVLGLLTIVVIFAFMDLIYDTNQQLTIPTLMPSPTPLPIEANINVTVVQTDENLALINGQTNLPDETIIMVWVRGTENEFSGQDRVSVTNGNFTAGPFGPSSGLYNGRYSVQTKMPYPKVQPLSVQEVIGQNGERLTGAQVVSDESGKLVITEKMFEIIIPTETPLPSPVPTPTPERIYLSGGDIGKLLYNEIHGVGLASVYRTDQIDGNRPNGEVHGGYKGGFTQFLVIELQFERYSQGYDDFDASSLWLWALREDNSIDYGAEKYEYHKYKSVRIYYEETVKEFIAFEIIPSSNKFKLCYQQCGPYGFQFNFGD